jgi:DNA-binding transcriptional MerR regulator
MEGTLVARQVDLLEDVSVAERVVDLEFTVGQVCRVAGITKMQLDYWTQRGGIPTRGNKQRLYDSRAVETVMLIKQARDLGFDVNAAIAAAKEFQLLKDERIEAEHTRRAA